MKKYVLVIVDERLMCYGLKKALCHELIEVDVASTASEALMALSACNYDLCLLDVRLPDESGFKMMEVVRDFCPKIKIILMTPSDTTSNDDLNNNIQKNKIDGNCYFLYKPFDLKKLQGIVSHVLSKNGDIDNKEQFEKSFSAKTRRRLERRKWSEKILFFLSVINDGKIKRMVFPAESVDVSDDGVKIITPYPLRPNQVISFDDDLERKSGVVVWSSLLEDQRCEAGVRLA